MAVINIFLEHIYEALDQLQSFNKYSYENKLLKVLKYASDLGISGLECDFFRLWDEAKGEPVLLRANSNESKEKSHSLKHFTNEDNAGTVYLKSLFDEAGLSVASIYRTFDFGHALREESLRQIDEVLKCAKLYGADKILAIPGFINEDDDGESVISKMTELLKLFVERAGKLGIRVTLEDFDLNTAPYSTISGLKCFFENVPGLGYTFDTGNFAYSLEDELEAYNALRPYICHVHLKDRSWDESRADKKASNAKANLSGRLMYPSEVGGGFIKIRECLELLKKDGYEGSFSIEHFGAVNQLEYMKKSVFNLKDMLLEYKL
jgi:sugar phosphate isomerase/epimerase